MLVKMSFLVGLAIGVEELTEQQRKDLGRPISPYAIGAGFEGTASDWVEYLVWSVGIIALLYHFSGVVKINVHEPLPKECTIQELDDDDHDDDEDDDDDVAKKDL